jgi:hypothetical protein
MKQETIVSILGVALVLWWFTTGEKAVTSMDSHLQRLLAAADPWINSDKSRSQRGESRVSLILYELTERCQDVMKEIKNDFQNMIKDELNSFIYRTLTNLAKTGEGLRHIIAHIDGDIAAGHKYVDGLYTYSAPEDTAPMKDVYNNLNAILLAARRLGNDLQRQLGMDEEEINSINEPLAMIIGH